MIKIAINGFGRIGRAAFKIASQRTDLEITAINDLANFENLVYLLKYDSIYGRWDKDIIKEEGKILMSDKEIKVFAEKDPANLPWKELGIDVVLECTGFFTAYEGAKKHLEAGAKKVIISAPPKESSAQENNIPIYVLGVNTADKIKEDIISNASCTTNCIAPIMEILERCFGVEKSLMTTVHAYTATQNLVDGPASKDFRRGRAGALNLSPASTGAVLAVTQILPNLAGKFDGLAIRVPIPVVSLSDITSVLKKSVSVKELNQLLQAETKSARYAGILDYTEDAVVSSDFIGNPHSAIIDSFCTRAIDNLVKIGAWYDNEWGYAKRLVDLAEKLEV